MWTTCRPNAHVTMDTPLLAGGVISDTVGQMGSVPSGEEPHLGDGMFYRAVSSPHPKYPHHFAGVGADIRTSEGRFLLSILSPASGPACNFGDPGCRLAPRPLLWLPCVGHVSGPRQLLEHSKSIHTDISQ